MCSRSSTPVPARPGGAHAAPRSALGPNRADGCLARSQPARRARGAHPRRVRRLRPRVGCELALLAVYRDETRRADAPAVEPPKTALARCDVHAERLLRTRGVRARVWGVLGAHVVRFGRNGLDPQTRLSRLRSAFWRAGAAPAVRRVGPAGHTGRKGHGPAPAGARRARRPTGGWVLPWIRTRAPGPHPSSAPACPPCPTWCT